MSQSSEIAVTTDGKLVSREETHEGKSICHLAVIRLHPLPTVSPEETQHVKIESWPQTAEIHTKGMISVSPESCIFPHIEKC